VRRAAVDRAQLEAAAAIAAERRCVGDAAGAAALGVSIADLQRAAARRADAEIAVRVERARGEGHHAGVERLPAGKRAAVQRERAVYAPDVERLRRDRERLRTAVGRVAACRSGRHCGLEIGLRRQQPRRVAAERQDVRRRDRQRRLPTRRAVRAGRQLRAVERIVGVDHAQRRASQRRAARVEQADALAARGFSVDVPERPEAEPVDVGVERAGVFVDAALAALHERALRRVEPVERLGRHRRDTAVRQRVADRLRQRERELRRLGELEVGAALCDAQLEQRPRPELCARAALVQDRDPTGRCGPLCGRDQLRVAQDPAAPRGGVPGRDERLGVEHERQRLGGSRRLIELGLERGCGLERVDVELRAVAEHDDRVARLSFVDGHAHVAARAPASAHEHVGRAVAVDLVEHEEATEVGHHRGAAGAGGGVADRLLLEIEHPSPHASSAATIHTRPSARISPAP